MLRREVYATTGPRMTVRIFAGWDFAARDFKGDWVRAGYARGVPMGGELKPGKGAPSFLVSALKDPLGANLDRIQVVKGWVDAAGVAQEKVFNVTWSSPRQRKQVKGRIPAVGDTVDLTTATYTNTIGAAELHTVWRDPEFNPNSRAFYYARVLEIPTPRWTLYDAVRYKVKPPEGAALKAQERAYSSRPRRHGACDGPGGQRRHFHHRALSAMLAAARPMAASVGVRRWLWSATARRCSTTRIR